jgi:hypothetical protein
MIHYTKINGNVKGVKKPAFKQGKINLVPKTKVLEQHQLKMKHL